MRQHFRVIVGRKPSTEKYRKTDQNYQIAFGVTKEHLYNRTLHFYCIFMWPFFQKAKNLSKTIENRFIKVFSFQKWSNLVYCFSRHPCSTICHNSYHSEFGIDFGRFGWKSYPQSQTIRGDQNPLHAIYLGWYRDPKGMLVSPQVLTHPIRGLDPR